MLQKLKNRLKDQKGFTLIELLAVIVILGILAAIAVPSVLGIIDNSKRDAHVANAQQMISSAKMAIASNSTLQSGKFWLTLKYLEDNNYLDPVDSPDKLAYDKGTNTLYGASQTTNNTDPNISCVVINNGKIVGVRLFTIDGSGKRGIEKILSDTDITAGKTISPKDIVRDDVQPRNNAPAPSGG